MNRKAIGKRIAGLRIRRSLSTAELAQAIGKSQATVSRIENGKQGASVEMIEQIANILQVDPLFLLTDSIAGVVRAQLNDAVCDQALERNLEEPVCALGRMLTRGRKRKSYSQEQAAIALDIRDEDLVALERGEAFPSPQLIEQIQAVYGINTKDLYGLAYLKELHPELSMRIGQMELFLEMFLAFFGTHDMQTLMQTDLEAVIGYFSRKLEEARSREVAVVNKGQAGHFSVEHLSERLLKCLQEDEFYRICESLSRVYENDKKTETPASGHAAATEKLSKKF